MISAIETSYNGYLFRSRLEARWAVFFDTAGIKYQYELQGFNTGPQGWYLPDFFLPDILSGVWFEVKGRYPTDSDMGKLEEVRNITSNSVAIAHGDIPFVKDPYAQDDNINTVLLYNEMAHEWESSCFIGKGSNDASMGVCLLKANNSSCKLWDDGDRAMIMDEAYRAARSARFEHGQNGALNGVRSNKAVVHKKFSNEWWKDFMSKQ